MRRGLLTASAFFAASLAMISQASHVNDPEITDTVGDSNFDFTDALRGWFDRTSSSGFEVTLQLASAPIVAGGVAGPSTVRYYVLFEPLDANNSAPAPRPDDYVRSFVAAIYTASGITYHHGHTERPQGAATDTFVIDGAVSGRRLGEVFVWTIPHSMFGIPDGDGAIGYRLRVPYVLVMTGATTEDRAPNVASGRDFVFAKYPPPSNGPSPPPPSIISDDSRGNPPSFSHYFHESNSTSIHYSMTGHSEAMEFAYSVTREAGDLDLSLVDPSGTLAEKRRLDTTMEGAFVFFDHPVGDWEVVIDYHSYEGGFSGTLRNTTEERPTSPTSAVVVPGEPIGTSPLSVTAGPGAPSRPFSALESGSGTIATLVGIAVVASLAAVVIFFARR